MHLVIICYSQLQNSAGVSQRRSFFTLNQYVGGSIPPRLTNVSAKTGEEEGHAVFGRVAEVADALDLGSSTERCAGSSPASPTTRTRRTDGKRKDIG